MDAQTIFYNQNGRLRSGWRFTIFLFSYLVLSTVLIAAAVSFLSILPVGWGENSLVTFAVTLSVFFVCALFLGWFYGKIFEDLPFHALGLWLTKNWLKNLFFGLLIGTLSIGFAALIPFVFGSISFQTNQSASASAMLSTLSATFLIFTIGAIYEETLFRGYMLQTFSRAKLFWVGMLLTSVLFASVHNNNPGANVFSWLNTFLAGIWFCIAYYKTRDLWFPFGIHLAWNWIQGSVLGINVSGLGDLASAPLLRSEDFGPVWLTGGGYGLEGGIACTIALVLSSFIIWFLPFSKPSEEMLELSGEEIQKGKS